MSKGLTVNIKNLEKKYRIVTDNLLDAIWVVDAETLKFEYITPSIEKISGYTAEEYRQFTIKDRLTPDSLQKALGVLAEGRKSFHQGIKPIRSLELELIHKNGNAYWVEIRARFIKENGSPLKIIGVIRNISQRKRAEHQKEELIKKLADTLAEKERLLKEIKVLHGLLPICSGCKRIRDEQDKWWPLDAYVSDRTEAQITHTICPDCKEVFYKGQ
jgi:PAS domain S-box-containing protein